MNRAFQSTGSIMVFLLAISLAKACDQPAKAVTLFDAAKKGYDCLSPLDLSKNLDWIQACEFHDFSATLMLNIDGHNVVIKQDGDASNAFIDITDDKFQRQEYDQKWCADVFVSFIPLFAKLANVSFKIDPNDFHIDWNSGERTAEYNFGRCHALVKTTDGSRSFRVYVDFGWAQAYNYIREWVGYHELTSAVESFQV